MAAAKDAETLREQACSFSTMMSIYMGKSAPVALNAREIFDLGWRVLWALGLAEILSPWDPSLAAGKSGLD